MENTKEQPELGYLEDEVVTPAEREFMKEILRRKEELEAFILDLINTRKHGGVIFHSLSLERRHLQPAYDFLREISDLVDNHVCKEPSPTCWAERVSKIRDSFIRFLGPHSIAFMTSSKAADVLKPEN